MNRPTQFRGVSPQKVTNKVRVCTSSIRPPGPNVIKNFSCSTQLSMKFEMVISIKVSRNSGFFSGSDRHRMLFFLLINVKMPTIVGILTFMSRKISYSVEVSMENFL